MRFLLFAGRVVTTLPLVSVIFRGIPIAGGGGVGGRGAMFLKRMRRLACLERRRDGPVRILRRRVPARRHHRPVAGESAVPQGQTPPGRDPARRGRYHLLLVGQPWPLGHDSRGLKNSPDRPRLCRYCTVTLPMTPQTPRKGPMWAPWAPRLARVATGLARWRHGASVTQRRQASPGASWRKACLAQHLAQW